MKIVAIIMFLSIILTGLTAGLLFAYSVSVIPGLARVSDLEYIHAMQSINREIQNPVFFLCFFGAFIALIISVFQYYPEPGIPFGLLLGAVIFYGIGVLGVTMFFNVPLNNMLDQFRALENGGSEIGQIRQLYESRWNFWHYIRTLSSIIAFVMALLASYYR